MRKWMRFIGISATVGMLGAGGGCASSSDAQRQAAEQKRTWLLEADMAAVAVLQARFGEMKVRAFKGLPPFNSPCIVVKRANGETVLDYYNAWVAAPHDLVRVQATRYLGKTGLFAAVHDAGAGTDAPLGLEGTVCELFLDCRSELPAAAVTLRLVVLDERAAAFTVLCSAEGTGRAAYNAESGDGIARAFNAALTQALENCCAALAR